MGFSLMTLRIGQLTRASMLHLWWLIPLESTCFLSSGRRDDTIRSSKVQPPKGSVALSGIRTWNSLGHGSLVRLLPFSGGIDPVKEKSLLVIVALSPWVFQGYLPPHWISTGSPKLVAESFFTFAAL